MGPRRVAIVGGLRVPFARSMTAYMSVSNQALLTTVLQGLVKKYNLQGEKLGEVVGGAVMKHSADWNMIREVTLDSGLSPYTPAYDVQQACGTSLEATILVANKIALGQIESGIACGSDTNSDLPFVFDRQFNHIMLESYRAKSMAEKIQSFAKLRPKHLKPVMPAVVEPRTHLSMGQSCELMAQCWQISRQEQDQLALASHANAAKAYEQGFYKDQILAFAGLEKDNNVRKDTSLDKLGKLKPAFEKSEKGTITAGNASPLTDGAAGVLLASEEWAKKKGLPILAYMGAMQTAAVEFVKEEGLLMAPAYAVAQMLQRHNLKLQDFDYYEIHEAFAAQVLCTLKAWESEEFCQKKLGLKSALGSIDRSKLNVVGGSVALGHPFAATGARIVSSLAKLLQQKGSGRGLISICTAGGMGVVATLERSN